MLAAMPIRIPLLTIVVLSLSAVTDGQERRAPKPTFSEGDTRGVFFDSLDEAFRDNRPTLATIRKASSAAAMAAVASTDADANQESSGGDGDWAKLIAPTSLEDEIKRLKLHYDEVVSTPGSFKGGGYQDARLDLSVLATLFAIINEYSGDVRWKDQAAAARDLIARTAFNCKAGSAQVYNEAKLRKADLQDLVAGSGLANRDAEPENDWSMIVDRSPLMEYAELLKDQLKQASRDKKSTEENAEAIRRDAQLLAMVGKVLTLEGLDDAEDDEYAMLSNNMSKAATAVATAMESKTYEIGPLVGAVTQSCDACHEQYR
ncbi:secreted protein [Rhodopirellula maiorica SM1]|uniref:Secreted protein n=2 Tax=Novipirellula TaxID=2795426 RepID=M5RQB8_9BACT|nr:secreted protein [Rhodopirellula maiorica SM1]